MTKAELNTIRENKVLEFLRGLDHDPTQRAIGEALVLPPSIVNEAVAGLRERGKVRPQVGRRPVRLEERLTETELVAENKALKVDIVLLSAQAIMHRAIIKGFNLSQIEKGRDEQ